MFTFGNSPFKLYNTKPRTVNEFLKALRLEDSFYMLYIIHFWWMPVIFNILLSIIKINSNDGNDDSGSLEWCTLIEVYQ